MNKELPEGWKRVKVGLIAKLYRGINYTKDVVKDLPSVDYLPILRGNNINVDLNYNDLVYVPKELIKSEQLIQKDDIIFAMSSGSKHLVGKSAVAKVNFNGSYGAFCALLRVNDNTDKKYVSLIFRGNSFRKLISEIAKGTNINNLKREHILDFQLLLPPLTTQQAIVSKIEELFSELDKGIENLKTAQQQLKVYRQSVLKWAFEGKLTNGLNHDSFDLPDENDLNQAAEPQEVYQSAKHQENQANQKNHCADKDGLPEGWRIVYIKDLAENNKHALKAGPFGSSLKKEFYVEKGYKIYGQEQVIKNDAFFGDYYINEEKYQELKSCSIKPFDILISLVGTVGKVLLLPENCRPGVINPRLIKISLDKKVYSPKFFKYYFESSFVKTFYKAETRGTTMDVLNLGIIKTIPFPLCSIEEQEKVVQEIESRQSVADKMEETIQQSLLQAESLRQSILKKAFEGGLVK